MHAETLPSGSRQTLDWLTRQSAPVLRNWMLAGGTGLALQIGHRISEDFDFFRTDAMDVRTLHNVFKTYGAYETLQEAEHTLTVRLDRTKLSFFCVRDPFLFSGLPYLFFTIADITDIALMKIAAISGRGSRKDFVDLFFILSGSPFFAGKSCGLPQEGMAFLASQGSAKIQPSQSGVLLRRSRLPRGLPRGC
ncbi:MAG: nucleotidyl transferase AbiEii/AbiGii toxin family protein, partial [Kiritimatiellota bacterium]|nr:nucleotidyl transferase AbiEii/AbiGii toxin family protein [Kiritimatiellota bacterium]